MTFGHTKTSLVVLFSDDNRDNFGQLVFNVVLVVLVVVLIFDDNRDNSGQLWLFVVLVVLVSFYF